MLGVRGAEALGQMPARAQAFMLEEVGKDGTHLAPNSSRVPFGLVMNRRKYAKALAGDSAVMIGAGLEELFRWGPAALRCIPYSGNLQPRLECGHQSPSPGFCLLLASPGLSCSAGRLCASCCHT